MGGYRKVGAVFRTALYQRHGNYYIHRTHPDLSEADTYRQARAFSVKGYSPLFTIISVFKRLRQQDSKLGAISGYIVILGSSGLYN